jgi:hypothetical protein
MPSRLKSATDEISAYFANLPNPVFTLRDIQRILAQQRLEWNLPASVGTRKFVDFLLSSTALRQVSPRSELYGVINRFAWGEVSPYLIALSMKSKSYLSHGTAVSLHALTDQIPKIVYVNHEQTVKPPPTGDLTQESLDRAFSHAQRRSKYIFHNESWQFVILSGKNTGDLGVITLPSLKNETLHVTSLERTLIDIVVRPDYSGGVYQILQAYRSAREKMSANVLLAHLKKLDYRYPFHQAIGFYMQRAGYESERWERLRALPIRFDFYLSHNIVDKAYDKDWRLFFPKGFE